MESFLLEHDWDGSTADDGYVKLFRGHTPGKPDVWTSAGGGDNADVSRWNPEDLLGLSLVTCHVLTFLALARKIRADVRRVRTNVEVVLEPQDKIKVVTKVILKGTLDVAPGTDHEKLDGMWHKAHKYCYIANSIKAEIVLEAKIEDVAV